MSRIESLAGEVSGQYAALEPAGRRVSALAHPVAPTKRVTRPGGAPDGPEGRLPVLFLDYDNVLHPCDAFRTRYGIRPTDPRAGLFQFARVLEELLSPYPQLRIVLSTSWVEILGFTRARDRLPLPSLRDRVIGATYHSKHPAAHLWMQLSRGAQVRRCVARHGLQNWVAIDDRDDGFDGVEKHLVKCQPGIGLGDGAVQCRMTDRLADLCPACR
ncbi:HAD domain-containing protein [Paraburkholderia dipogonis]|uniref:HAD domain-containing protein n=1 Tax=Paraburkholderia dipogonis TaxID=1211383 RepID=A0ABW9B7J4_9BURK